MKKKKFQTRSRVQDKASMKKKKFRGLFYIDGFIVFSLEFSAQDTKAAWNKFAQAIFDEFGLFDYSEMETMQMKVRGL
jgi:hypothetical protein